MISSDQSVHSNVACVARDTAARASSMFFHQTPDICDWVSIGSRTDAMERKRTQPRQRNEELRNRCSDVLFYSETLRVVYFVETYFDPHCVPDRVSLCSLAEVFFPLQRNVADVLENSRKAVHLPHDTTPFVGCEKNKYKYYPPLPWPFEICYSKYCEPLCMAAAGNARFFATWLFDFSGVQPWWQSAFPMLRCFCFRNWTDLVQRIAPLRYYGMPEKYSWANVGVFRERGFAIAKECIDAPNLSDAERTNLLKTTMLHFRFDEPFVRMALVATTRVLRSAELLDWQRQEFGTPAVVRSIFGFKQNSQNLRSGDAFARRCVDVLRVYGERFCDTKSAKANFVRYATAAIQGSLSNSDFFRHVLTGVQPHIADVFRKDWLFSEVLACSSEECVRELAARFTPDEETVKRLIWGGDSMEETLGSLNPRRGVHFLQNGDAAAIDFILTHYNVPREVFLRGDVLRYMRDASYYWRYAVPFAAFRCVVDHYDIRARDIDERRREDFKISLFRNLDWNGPNAVQWAHQRFD